MKTIGLIGGMSWESTVTYYQIINETVRDGLGGLHSAKILLYSVDFAEIEECQAKGEWERSGEILADVVRELTRPDVLERLAARGVADAPVLRRLQLGIGVDVSRRIEDHVPAVRQRLLHNVPEAARNRRTLRAPAPAQVGDRDRPERPQGGRRDKARLEERLVRQRTHGILPELCADQHRIDHRGMVGEDEKR